MFCNRSDNHTTRLIKALTLSDLGGLEVGAPLYEGRERVEVRDEDEGVHELRHGPLVLRSRQTLDHLLRYLPRL